jgi:hypothetical protein
LVRGTHTIRIVVTQAKNTASTGNYQDVEAFEVLGMGDGATPVSIANPVFAASPLSVTPNPFNPQVMIRFSLDKKAFISVNIYDVRGSLVKNLMQNELAAGPYSVTWNGQDNSGKRLSTGIYMVRLTGKGRVELKRVIFVK